MRVTRRWLRRSTLASVMLVNDQQQEERSYLDELAGQLQIDPDLQLHLEQQAKA